MNHRVRALDWTGILGFFALVLAIAGCSEEPVPAVGERLPSLTVKRCDGSDVALDSFCGADALYIFVAHGWCPLCKRVSAREEEIHDSFTGVNLAAVNVVVETGLNEEPDGAYCDLWRSTNHQEDVVTLYDPEGVSLSLWEEDTSSLSAFVDKDCLITGKLTHNSDIDMIKAGIQAALDH